MIGPVATGSGSLPRPRHRRATWSGRGLRGRSVWLMTTLRILCAALALLPLFGCASYQIGQRALYRPDIRTVHVPIFESDSFRRNLGERLSEAVAMQIEMRTPYRLADAATADSVLRGKIVTETKRMIAEDQFDQPRVLETDLVCQIDWIGPQGELLAHNISVPLDDYLLVVGHTEQLIPEGGQSMSTTHQEAIERLAEQIVGQMEIAPY